MGFNFEHKMNHWGKGLSGTDLSASMAFDEIIMIRTVEMNMNQIVKDPEILFPCMFDKKKLIHIYKEYCATKLTEERNEKGELVDLPRVHCSTIDNAVALAFLHAEI